MGTPAPITVALGALGLLGFNQRVCLPSINIKISLWEPYGNSDWYEYINEGKKAPRALPECLPSPRPWGERVLHSLAFSSRKGDTECEFHSHFTSEQPRLREGAHGGKNRDEDLLRKVKAHAFDDQTDSADECVNE